MDFVRLKEDLFFIRLDRGERVNETLKKFCAENEVKAGKISGIGALEKIELGFYDYHQDSYDKKILEKEHELLSMEGNVSIMDGAPFVHLHVTLSNDKYEALGGHMFEGTVAVTLECYLEIFDFEFLRHKGPKERFRPISL